MLWYRCLKVVKVEKEVWVGCKIASISLNLDSVIVQVSYVCGAAAEEQVVQVEQEGQVDSQTWYKCLWVPKYKADHESARWGWRGQAVDP